MHAVFSTPADCSKEWSVSKTTIKISGCQRENQSLEASNKKTFKNKHTHTHTERIKQIKYN